MTVVKASSLAEDDWLVFKMKSRLPAAGEQSLRCQRLPDHFSHRTREMGTQCVYDGEVGHPPI